MITTRRVAVLLLATVLPFVGLAAVPAAATAPAVAAIPAVAASVPEVAASGPAVAAAAAVPNPAPATRPVPATEKMSDGPVDYTSNCPAEPAPGTYTCFSLRRTGNFAHLAANVPPSGFGPADLQSAYALPSSSAGAGQVVYVIDAFGYPDAAADLAHYRSTYQLPPLDCQGGHGCFKKLNQAGQTSPLPTYDAGWAGETALDLAMVSAICPNCSITLIEATDNSNNLFTAVDRANRLGAKFVSMSWGGPETGQEGRFDSSYFGRTGVVYAASSGDGGYQEGSNYPSTSGNAVAVGGTTLAMQAGTTRGWSEFTWGNDIAHGTGSGCSSDETKPAWQAIIAASVCTRRAGNDVAAVADPNTGVAVYQTGPGLPTQGWSIVGGTSASAPIITSVYALAGAPRSADRPASYPYARSGSLNDINQGINGYCSPDLLCGAATGWDGPTGLGTPDGVAAFAPPAQAITVANPDNQASPVGVPVGLTVAATDVPSRAVTFTATNLPAGLSISAAGVISGTPTVLFAYVVTVTATDSTGATGSVVFPWTIAKAGTFLPLPSNRLLDTRYGVGAPKAAVATKGAVVLQVLGRGGVPPSGVSSVVLNVTVTAPTAAGYVTVYPHGSAQPFTSNISFVKGQTVPDLVIAPVGADGKVTLFTSAGTHLIADVSGFYLNGAAAALAAVPGSFGPLAPRRILDTRYGLGAPAGAVPAGQSIALAVLGNGGVPASGVSAVVLSVTVTAPTAAGYVTVYPNLVARPASSNVNFVKGQTVSNLVVAPIGADGKVRLFALAGAQLIADVAGYFTTKPGPAAASGGTLTTVGPARLLDTRTNTGDNQGPVGNLQTVFLKVTGVGGVAPAGVTAVVLDVVVVGPTGAGYLTAYSAGSGQPATSNLNYVAGRTVANLVVVPVSPDGFIALTVDGAGTVDLVADVFGYYNAQPS